MLHYLMQYLTIVLKHFMYKYEVIPTLYNHLRSGVFFKDWFGICLWLGIVRVLDKRSLTKNIWIVRVTATVVADGWLNSIEHHILAMQWNASMLRSTWQLSGVVECPIRISGSCSSGKKLFCMSTIKCSFY